MALYRSAWLLLVVNSGCVLEVTPDIAVEALGEITHGRLLVSLVDILCLVGSNGNYMGGCHSLDDAWAIVNGATRGDTLIELH